MRINIVILLTVFVLTLSGCKDNVVSKDSIPDVTEVINENSDTEVVELETEETNADNENEDFWNSDNSEDSDDFFDSLFGEMKLPENFPDDYLPIPDEADIDGTNTMSFDGKTILVVEYIINSNEEEIKELYETHFTKRGFEVEYVSEAVQGDYTTVSMKENDKEYVAQILDLHGGVIRVILTYQES